MKKIVLLIGIVLLAISCRKNDFDLDKTSFPINIDSLITKYKINEDNSMSGFIRYYTTDENLLYFNGFNFSGSLDNLNGLFKNKLSFYKEGDQIKAYQIDITTSSEAEEFENILMNKLGKTDFYYKNTDFSFRIWDFEGKLYFFETNNTGNYNGKKFNSCDLYVIDNKDEFFIKYVTAGGFQYYGDYLYEKSKPENSGKKFTYRDFINLEEKEDGQDSYFLKDYVK